MNPLQGIVKFNTERKLINFDALAEFKMLEEELMEFFSATTVEDQIDALADLIVVATGGIHKLGYDPEAALMETVKEILSRQGTFHEETGKWKKDPNQDPETLYKANYDLAKV